MDTTLDESRKIRRTVRDLVALSTLPAVWVGYHPPQIAESLADLLLDSLSLDFIYLRLWGEASGPVAEVARTGRRPASAGQARDVGGALVPWLGQLATGSVKSIPNPAGSGT